MVNFESWFRSKTPHFMCLGPITLANKTETWAQHNPLPGESQVPIGGAVEGCGNKPIAAESGAFHRMGAGWVALV